MKEQSQKRNVKDRQLKINSVVHKLKDIIIRNRESDQLHDYLFELFENKPSRDQLKPLDKMIKTVCTRLKSALKMVDHFVFAIKCLQSSTRCSQDAFSEEDFNKCLDSLEEVTKRKEINEWIRNIRKFIDKGKKTKSTNDKKQQIKKLQQTASSSYFKKKIGQFQIVKTKTNKSQNILSLQSKEAQIRQKQAQTQKPHIKDYSSTVQKEQNAKENFDQERVKICKYEHELEANIHGKNSIKLYSQLQKLKNKDLTLISHEIINQNHQIIQENSIQCRKLDIVEQQNFQNEKQEQQDNQLIKNIFVIKNINNLNFLKKAIWDECKLKIKKAEKIYSSEQIQDFRLNQTSFKDKNILLVIQLVNGLVLGGFKWQEKYNYNQRNCGFMFSLTRKEVFSMLSEKNQLQILKLNQKQIIFGRGELKINNEDMIVKIDYCNGKGVFDFKGKDLDFLIGESSQKTTDILEYAIYQII